MATQYNPLSSSSSLDEGLSVIISLMEWMSVDRQYAAVARPWLIVVGGKWHSSQEQRHDFKRCACFVRSNERCLLWENLLDSLTGLHQKYCQSLEVRCWRIWQPGRMNLCLQGKPVCGIRTEHQDGSVWLIKRPVFRLFLVEYAVCALG